MRPYNTASYEIAEDRAGKISAGSIGQPEVR